MSRLRLFLTIGASALLPALAQAFPPAPFIQVHGVVRDDYGWVIEAVEAEVQVRSGGQVIAQGIIGFDPLRARNYELRLPVSSLARAEGDEYRPNAINPDDSFTFVVILDEEEYLPIEVAFGEEFVAAPGAKVEVNLTLGQDDDRDGLPDDWEFFQLEAAGIRPGSDLYSLDTLSLGSDSDGDGQSNLDEFIAGTFAFDARDTLAVELGDFDEETGLASFQIFAVFGKRYQLSGANDETLSFQPVILRRENRQSATGSILWTANFTGFVTLYAPFDPEAPSNYFLLRVF